MAVIRVDPASIHQYAGVAQGQFDAIRAELQGLVNDAVNARYFGPNAVEFKARSGQMAAEFGQRLGIDLAHIAQAVRSSTTAIATALGGAPVAIAVSGAPVAVPPVPAGDGSVEIDTAGLDALKPLVARHIAAITADLSAHLRSLQATDWQGAAKDAAVAAVSQFTSGATEAAHSAQSSISGYIDRQIATVLAIDR